MENDRQTRALSWWLLLPFRFVAEVTVGLYDFILSRYLVAAVLVGIIWVPLHLIWGISTGYYIWPTLIIGLILTGLWEGCSIFTIRHRVPRWMLLRED